MAGMLYLVPTPIGNLGDISQRCRETLERVDFIAAEDTRVTLKLMNHLGIKKPLISYFEHNKASKGGGQMLVGVAGRGWYQEEGKPAQPILPGTVIHIPANVKHWHGAAADSWFAHLAFGVPGEDMSNEWLEPVSDEVYDKLPK